MLKIALIASLAASTVAFRSTIGARPSLKRTSMTAEGLAGQTSPLGYFDPLGLSSDKLEGDVKKIREAELKHGRVAMIAFVGILVGENYNPLFDGKITGPAINQFQQADDMLPFFWAGVLFLIALIEGQNIRYGWENSEENAERGGNIIAQLKPDYINGDIGFDPLNLTPTDPAEFDEIRTKELNNGRLAMLAVAGIVAQELVNGKGVLENLNITL